jgi:hypothetical protein
MSINGTMKKIQTVTVGVNGQAAIDFNNVPQTYDDLVILISPRSIANSISSNLFVQFNNASTGHSDRYFGGSGSTTFTGTVLSNNNRVFIGDINANTSTSNIFGSTSVYITNYKSSSIKSLLIDSVGENNDSTAYSEIISGQFNGSAITSIKIMIGDGSTLFMQHSTATLYGITRVPAAAKATGGMIYDDSSYWYHAFTSSGTFTPNQNITCDVLVVGGGGGSGLAGLGTGGGGGGGLLDFLNQSLTSTSYTVTVGGGGATNANGGDSQFGALTLVKGGGRGADDNGAAGSQGSGGGGNWSGNSGGGTATSGQGSNGGTGSTQSNVGVGGGGGGKTAVGQNSNSNTKAGDGGSGSSAYSSWMIRASLGQDISGTRWLAGGGGGGVYDVVGSRTPGVGGNGGGGTGGSRLAGSAFNATAGLSNTGGGGGGAGQNGGGSNASAGGSGLVIVRYAK